MRELGGLDGFARVQWSARRPRLEGNAMDRLGPSLQTALKKAENRLPLAAWSSVGVEALGVLERLHEQAQLLHLDVKPSNLLADAAGGAGGGALLGAALRLVDFGSRATSSRVVAAARPAPARRHAERRARRHRAVRERRQPRAARAGRRDDLESLAYMLVYLRTGSLPWRKVEAPTQPVRIKMTLIKKQRAADGVDLCCRRPWAGIRALEHAGAARLRRAPRADRGGGGR